MGIASHPDFTSPAVPLTHWRPVWTCMRTTKMWKFPAHKRETWYHNLIRTSSKQNSSFGLHTASVQGAACRVFAFFFSVVVRLHMFLFSFVFVHVAWWLYVKSQSSVCIHVANMFKLLFHSFCDEHAFSTWACVLCCIFTHKKKCAPACTESSTVIPEILQPPERLQVIINLVSFFVNLGLRSWFNLDWK